MPIFDFICNECQIKFEELCSADDKVVCPKCASANTDKLACASKPFKKGFFPYKRKKIEEIRDKTQKRLKTAKRKVGQTVS